VQIWLNYVDQILIYAAFAVSLNLLLGYAGQVSVAHAAFGAIGGYAMGYLAMTHGWSFLPGVLLGTAVALVAGFLLALPAMQLTVEYLILLTLAVSFVIVGVLQTFAQLGGTYGLIGIPKAQIFGWTMLRPADWVIPSAVMLIIVFLICRRIGESAYGRVLKGIREDPTATQAMGKNVFRFKLTVFGLSSAMAGLAGGFYSGWLQLATPTVYGFPFSLTLFVIVIFGGMANLYGSILGAVVVVLLEPILRRTIHLDASRASVVLLIVYGSILVVLMLLRPQGAIPEGAHPLRRLRWVLTARGEQTLWVRLRHGPAGARLEMDVSGADWAPTMNLAAVESGDGETVPATRTATVDVSDRQFASPAEAAQGEIERQQAAHRRWEAAEPVLVARGIGKRFGGIIATQDLDIDLRLGTITALVGPNGAGKTTVFNLLTGFIPPDTGSVKLRGEELVGLSPDRIARMGLVRSFQDVRLISRITCLQNVMLAVQDQAGERLAPLFFGGRAARRSEAAAQERAMRWLSFVGMTDFADVPAGALSYGQSKLISLARLLATEAPVLLLDEPASGIDTRWVETMLQMIEALREQNRTVCIVEHNLHVVRRLADHTYFMELGRITAQGSIDELTRSPELAEAYFGS
jgi:branched-chain amino acid transport system ATP-binding protein/branched-chain amino acid transport system permease protein